MRVSVIREDGPTIMLRVDLLEHYYNVMYSYSHGSKQNCVNETVLIHVLTVSASEECGVVLCITQPVLRYLR